MAFKNRQVYLDFNVESSMAQIQLDEFDLNLEYWEQGVFEIE